MGRFRPDHYPHYRIGSWIGGGPWSTDLPATNGYPRTMLFFADGSVTVVEMGVFGGSSVLGGTNRLHRGSRADLDHAVLHLGRLHPHL